MIPACVSQNSKEPTRWDNENTFVYDRFENDIAIRKTELLSLTIKYYEIGQSEDSSFEELSEIYSEIEKRNRIIELSYKTVAEITGIESNYKTIPLPPDPETLLSEIDQ